MSSNRYAAPRAAVSDIEGTQEYQEIRMWSASGRLGRLRYLAYATGAYLVAVAIAGGLAAVVSDSLGAILVMLVYIATLVFTVLVSIKRSHDMDWSGWTVLLSLIPFVGLIWLFKRGSEGTNGYGAPPPPNTTGVKILGFLFPILAVVGILAAIAIPAYAEYTRRAAGG